MKISKKRVVLFLLFIFPLICFLLLSTGQNNFTKLPVVTKNILDISSIDSTKTFKNNISIEFPQIQVKSVNFNNQADSNTINLFVNYLIRNIGKEDQINIAIQ